MHVSFYDCDTPYSPTCTGDNKRNGLGCLCLVSSPEKVSIHLFSRGIFRFKKLWNLWNFLFHSSALVFFPPKKSSCAFSDRAAGGREIRRIRVRSWRAFFLSILPSPPQRQARLITSLFFPFPPQRSGGKIFPSTTAALGAKRRSSFLLLVLGKGTSHKKVVAALLNSFSLSLFGFMLSFSLPRDSARGEGVSLSPGAASHHF